MKRCVCDSVTGFCFFVAMQHLWYTAMICLQRVRGYMSDISHPLVDSMLSVVNAKARHKKKSHDSNMF